MRIVSYFTLLGAMSVTAIGYAQTQTTPDTQSTPSSQSSTPDQSPPDSQSQQGTNPNSSSPATPEATTPQGGDTNASAASSEHQRAATSQTNQQEAPPNENPNPAAASTPHQRDTTRMAAAGKVESGMEVQSQSGDSLGTVVAIIPDASGNAQYAVISSSTGSATAVPYNTATSMVRNNALVIDKARLQNAPKVPQDHMYDSSTSAWKQKADSYWGKYPSTQQPSHDSSSNTDEDSEMQR